MSVVHTLTHVQSLGAVLAKLDAVETVIGGYNKMFMSNADYLARNLDHASAAADTERHDLECEARMMVERLTGHSFDELQRRLG